MKHVPNRFIVSIDLDGKNWHTFEHGTTIRIERRFDNFDVKYTRQTMGVVVSAENVPAGALILFHPNATHDVNRIFNASQTGSEQKTIVVNGIEETVAADKLYSIPDYDCFLWKMPGEKEWKPIEGYEIALRVFKPYEGLMQGIEPKQVKNVLFLLTGDLAGKACHTLKASDYELIFNNEKGVEQRLIRVRHSADESFDREEIVAVDNYLTEKILNHKFMVGINPSDAKPYEPRRSNLS